MACKLGGSVSSSGLLSDPYASEATAHPKQDALELETSEQAAADGIRGP